MLFLERNRMLKFLKKVQLAFFKLSWSLVISILVSVAIVMTCCSLCIIEYTFYVWFKKNYLDVWKMCLEIFEILKLKLKCVRKFWFKKNYLYVWKMCLEIFEILKLKLKCVRKFWFKKNYLDVWKMCLEIFEILKLKLKCVRKFWEKKIFGR